MRTGIGLPARIKRVRMLGMLGLLLAFVLVACDSQPAVLVATPVPPDSNFRTYRHQTGVFSLRMPPDWAVRDVSQGGAVRVEFSPPGNAGLPLTVYIVNTGAPLTTNALLENIGRYQQIVNGDPAYYHEISRTAQGDGSWRMVGVRQTSIGPRTLNTFLQADGPLLTAIESDVTGLSDAQMQTLRTVINTIRVDSASTVAQSDIRPIAENASTNAGVLRFESLLAWTTPRGEFVINGLVTNQSGGPLEAIRVTAILSNAAGDSLAEQQSVIPVEVLANQASAPFSVRFRNGKPAQTIRYELQAAARNAEFALKSYLGDDKFIKGNDLARYNASGFLVVGGDIVNQTQGAAYFVKAVITIFDEQSRVVAMDSIFLNKPQLLPGEVGRFEATFPELGGNGIRYTISVEGKSQQGE